jgi:hypothetical protein
MKKKAGEFVGKSIKEATEWYKKRKKKKRKPLTEDQLGKAIIGTSVVSSVPLSFLAQNIGEIQREATPRSVKPKTKPKTKPKKASKPKGKAPWEEFMGESRKKASKELKKYMKEKRQRKSDKQNKHIKKPGKGSRKPTDRDKD